MANTFFPEIEPNCTKHCVRCELGTDTFQFILMVKKIVGSNVSSYLHQTSPKLNNQYCTS